MPLNLDAIPVSQWTTLEATRHLAETFDIACRSYPDIMEPYMVLLAEAQPDQFVEIMRRGLRETIETRFDSAYLRTEAAILRLIFSRETSKRI